MSKGGKVPQPYMPTGQGQADAGYQNLVSNATPWATNLPGQVIPGLQNVVTNVQNNPYAAGAQQGANSVADLATGTIAPGMLQAAGGLQQLGQQSIDSRSLMTDPVFSAAQMAYSRGQGLADTASSLIMPMVAPGMQKAGQAWNTTMGAIPGLTGGMGEAQQLLDNGFDPQSQLYDRQYQQMMDQQNAINSMYGVSSSPYGAGVAGDASRNFNIDWQNNQLGRQLAALQGYGQHTGQVTSNLTNLVGTGSGAYNDLMNGSANRGIGLMTSASNSLNQGVDNLRQGYATGSDIYRGLNTDAANLWGAASAHGTDALNTLGTASALPNSTYLANQDSQIAALQALAQGAGLSLAPTGQLIDAQGRYLNIGQQATQLAQNAAQIKAQQSAAGIGGIAQGLGTLAGLALAPMTGGLSLFGSAAGGAGIGAGMGAIVSDRRLKHSITRLSTRRDGAGVYRFKYVGSDIWQIGVMADEIQKVRPDAVVTLPNGYLAVDHGKLAA